jgi:hypothetical protein
MEEGRSVFIISTGIPAGLDVDGKATLERILNK